MIEVDDALNTRDALRKICSFYSFGPKSAITKNFERSQEALFITSIDLNFFLQDSNLIFKLNLLTDFLNL